MARVQTVYCIADDSYFLTLFSKICFEFIQFNLYLALTISLSSRAPQNLLLRVPTLYLVTVNDAYIGGDISELIRRNPSSNLTGLLFVCRGSLGFLLNCNFCLSPYPYWTLVLLC